MLKHETLGLQGARDAASQAESQFRQAEASLQRVKTVLSSLYARLQRNVPEFLARYVELRQLLPHERDPINGEIAMVCQQQEPLCPKWVEGFVASAVALAYEGKDTAAAEYLERAGEVFEKCPPLIGTLLAEDCCATWLLLGRPDKVGRYVAAIKSIRAQQRSAMHEWLLGADARVRGRYDDAKQILSMALGKAKKKAPPALVAEAALAHLLADPQGRRTKKAADLLEDVKHDESWPVLQSRAALAAAEERWGDAVHLIDQCRAKAPPCLASELDGQQASYASEKVWHP